MSHKNFSQAHGKLIAPGQIWMAAYGQSTEKGTWYQEWRVMAVAEGYAMGRVKGAMPSVVAVKDMADWKLKRFTRSGEVGK
jgi:hypothetical protein